MSTLIIFVVLCDIKAGATLDKGGHILIVNYDIQVKRSEAIDRIDVWFHHKGISYCVATHRYIEPVTSICDTFVWVSKDRWKGGDLELTFYQIDGGKTSHYIPESRIATCELSIPYNVRCEYWVNYTMVKSYKGKDPYAWRMLGYDAGHTGYYPFHLYPPLDSLWMYRWSGAGTWTTMISGAAGHGMIFIPEAPWGWNKIQARDIETGEVIWERVVTANVWTSVLSEGDSILFVGTSIGFTPWQDTTFYALDPFTGKLKWGKVLKTVEYSPIVVDSFVYAPHFYKVYCFTYKGDSVWAGPGAYSSPVYEDGIIIGAATDSILNARDYLTGELLWDFVGSGWIFNLMAYEDKVIFSPFFDPLYALDIHTGDMVWTNWDYGLTSNAPLNGGYSRVFWGHGVYVGDTMFTIFRAITSQHGEFIWETLLQPADTNQGRMTRIIISQDTILVVPNCGRVYVFKGDSLIYYLNLPQSLAQHPNGQFPIAYKNTLIFAHEDFLVVYKADTVFHNTAGDSLLSLSNLKVYGDITTGQLHLEIDLPEKSWVNLKIFDILGREMVTLLNDYLMRGRHSLSFDLQSLPTGVYFLRAEIKGEKRENIVRKFLVLR